MTRLILTTNDSGAGSLKQAGLADIVIPFGFRFVWDHCPPPRTLRRCSRRVPRNTTPLARKHPVKAAADSLVDCNLSGRLIGPEVELAPIPGQELI
jgi:hypothetical protein